VLNAAIKLPHHGESAENRMIARVPSFLEGEQHQGYYADATSSMGLPLIVSTITCGEEVASAGRILSRPTPRKRQRRT